MSIYIPSEEELLAMEAEEQRAYYNQSAKEYRDKGLLPGGEFKELKLDELVPFPNHPFKLYTGDRLDDMVQSIKECGVLSPIIARVIDGVDTYQILAGHNRVEAAKIAGITTIPAMVIGALTDDEAMLIVTETNLVQRSFADLTHSERAKSIFERHNALKCQGKRFDLLQSIINLVNADEQGENTSSSPMAIGQTSLDVVGNEFSLSKDTIARYLRVHELIEVLQERLDNDEFGLRVAVLLSYLKQGEQTALDDFLLDGKYKLDIKIAESLRSRSRNGTLTDETMLKVLESEKIRKPKAPAPFKLRYDVYSRYFNPDQKAKEVENIIDKALSEYFSNHEQEE